MRRLVHLAMVGLCGWMAGGPISFGQQFSSPTDLVETLYNSYFDGPPIDDLAPYLSDDLTRQLAGKVGRSEFKILGFDPIVGDPNWEPRDFRTELVGEAESTAQVKVSFVTRDMPVSITISLVDERQHGWQIDHIAGRAGDRTWCTNNIVALKPAGTSPD